MMSRRYMSFFGKNKHVTNVLFALAFFEKQWYNFPIKTKSCIYRAQHFEKTKFLNEKEK